MVGGVVFFWSVLLVEVCGLRFVSSDGAFAFVDGILFVLDLSMGLEAPVLGVILMYLLNSALIFSRYLVYEWSLFSCEFASLCLPFFTGSFLILIPFGRCIINLKRDDL